MNLQEFDLNLLKTLLVLLQERSTVKAAERLDTSQPLISRRLGKIRELLDDPLLVRHGRSLALTQKGEQLLVTLPDLMTSLSNALTKDTFSAAEQTGHLKLALDGFIIESYGYQLLMALKKAAPELKVELFNYSESSAALLTSGELDAAISLYPLSLNKEIRQTPLGAIEFGLLSSRQHPEVGRDLKLEEAAKYPIASLVIAGHNHRALILERLLDTSDELEIALRSDHIRPILQLIESSNVLMAAPVNLLSGLDTSKFAMIRVAGYKNEKYKRYALVYHNRHHHSDKYLWLESLVRQTIGDTSPADVGKARLGEIKLRQHISI